MGPLPSVSPVMNYLPSYKTAKKLSHFVAGQLSLQEQPFTLSIVGRPTGILGDLDAQIFLEF